MRQLGHDIATARKARGLTAEDMAERVGVDRGTLRRLEQGDPGATIHTLVMALSVLGLVERLAQLADIAQDDVALLGAKARLPQRVSKPRTKPGQGPGRPVNADASEPQAW
jgi:transcriptional regulator with XRE-family HTH domain